jgi:hypothetical protein
MISKPHPALKLGQKFNRGSAELKEASVIEKVLGL